MNFCPNCGTKIEDTWVACPNCGVPKSSRAPYRAGIPDGEFGTDRYANNRQVIRWQHENLDRTDRDKVNSRANVLSMTSMWFSIGGLLSAFFGGVIFSLVGIILGHIAQKNVRAAQGSESSYAKVGLIVGYFGLGLFLVFAVLIGAAVSSVLPYFEAS